MREGSPSWGFVVGQSLFLIEAFWVSLEILLVAAN